MFLRKTAPQKGCISLGLEHDPSPSRRQEHVETLFSRNWPNQMETIPFLAPKIRKLAKFRTLGAKNYIFAPMAPTLINVMVSLIFWDRFSSFSVFWAKFHYFGVKITFGAKKPQSRPKRPESCSRDFHFWTREKLEGFFASEECKIWSFFALSAQIAIGLSF